MRIEAMARAIACSAGAVLGVSGFSAPALAHHPGGTGNAVAAGPVNTIPATTLEQGHSAIAFFHEFIRFGGLSDRELSAAAGRHEHAHSIGAIQSPSLSASFGVTNDLTLSLRLPYVLRTDIREGHHAHTGAGAATNTVDARGDTSGIGDIAALGQWRFFNSQTTGTEAAALFGLKAPTGPTNRRDRSGEIFEAEFKPGSGSFDPLLGFAISQSFGRWGLHGNVLYQFTRTGTQHTDLGDRIQYNIAIAYRLLGATEPALSLPALAHNAEQHSHHLLAGSHAEPHRQDRPAPSGIDTWELDLVVELNGEWHDQETARGVKDRNSGGNTIYLSPGVRLGRGPLSAFASIGVPIASNLNGLQSEAKYRLVTGLAVGF